MSNNYIFKYITLLILVLLLTTPSNSEDKCMILNGPAKKAKPSLLQCYRDNAEACCNSETDSFISEKYGQMFTDSCKRKFPVFIPIPF